MTRHQRRSVYPRYFPRLLAINRHVLNKKKVVSAAPDFLSTLGYAGIRPERAD